MLQNISATEDPDADDDDDKEKRLRQIIQADERILYMETSERKRDLAMKCKETAECMYHIRSFYEACDDRGLSADERVRRLTEMQKFLTKDVDFDHFAGQHFEKVKSIPYKTYEAILGNVATRIQMYSELRDKTYNARSLSTLALENFFSTLSQKSENDCPKAVEVPGKMAELMDLNIAAHMSTEELRFEYSPTVRPTYEIRKNENLNDTQPKPVTSERKMYQEAPLFKNHKFDVPIPHKKARRHKYGYVTSDFKPLKGVKGIRSDFYKINEQKLNELHRTGLTDEKLALFNLLLPTNNDESESGSGIVFSDDSESE